MTFLSSDINRIWLLLCALTAITWALGEGAGDPESARYVTLALLVLAFIKIRFVVRQFMEVGRAVLLLRVLLDVWIVAVLGLIILFYLNPMMF